MTNQVQKLIAAVLEKGWTISVNDGEEWALKHSNDAKAIYNESRATDECIFRINSLEGAWVVGTVYIIWENTGEEICDYSSTEVMNALIEPLLGEDA